MNVSYRTGNCKHNMSKAARIAIPSVTIALLILFIFPALSVVFIQFQLKALIVNKHTFYYLMAFTLLYELYVAAYIRRNIPPLRQIS
jgi:hypothetical protein